MNTVRIPRLLKQATLLLTLLGSNFLLTACGGDGGKSSKSSSSSSLVSSHAFSSTSVTPPLSGTWPDVKVSANNTKTLQFDWTPAPDATYYKLFKKADLNSAYVQVGSDFNALTVSDPVSVHLTDWVNSRYKVQACTAADICTDSTEVVIDSAMLTSITYLKASNTDSNDWFGWSIALSGDGKTLAVGAPAESSNATGVNGDQTDNTSTATGAVYVFVKIDGSWSQQAYIKSPHARDSIDGVTRLPNTNLRFGYNLALSTDGNTLAVTAINEDGTSVGVNCGPYFKTYSSSSSNSQGYVIRETNYDVGAAYIFKRTNGVWTHQAYFKPRFNLSGLSFGFSLALSGDGTTLAVGTVADNFLTSGVKSLTTTACVDPSNSDSSLSVASSVSSSVSSSKSSLTSLSGNSSSSSLFAGGIESGAVYVYRLVEGTWVEEAYVKPSDSNNSDFFGTSITLSQDGNLMAVGAPEEDSKDSGSTNATITLEGITEYLDTGAVYIFEKPGDTWTEQVKIKPTVVGWKQSFGASVALSLDGNTLAVGAPNDWSKAVGVNGNPNDYEYKVLVFADYSLSRYRILPTEDSTFGIGAAYIFSKLGSTWSQEAYLKPPTNLFRYHFGMSLSLSGNGNVLAVGSMLESSQAKGINGDVLDTSANESGAAYVFKRAENSWSQTSTYVKAPNSDANDRFGRTLDLDDSGLDLIIGAHRESSNAKGINGNQSDNSNSAAGAVYVY
ncbi:MAG: hypothetical protein EOO52_10345 [Gammaproteobacteria bacterium]|nr:MAG: hypothetical protein EOO52_10345 [Gammaproteobacteria bacterium]